MKIATGNSERFFYCFSALYTLNFFIAERTKFLGKQRNIYSGSGILGILLLSCAIFQCDKPEVYRGPKFILSKPKILIPNIISNYVVAPRFDPEGRTIIFNGRLAGDSWDCIYTIPIQGGEYRKLIEATEDLLYPSYSSDLSKIIYTQGFARQIMLHDGESGRTSALPIFGNTPILLPDNETVLYSGVIDANLKLYHIPSNRSLDVTESVVSANFSPVLLSDNAQIRWIEKLRTGLFRLRHTNLESRESTKLYSDHKPIWSNNISPSGQWSLLNFQDGSLLAVHGGDSTVAPVEFQADNPEQPTVPLVALPDWSVNGSAVVFTTVMHDKYARSNPFFKHGYSRADLVIADLSWEKISNGDIIRPLPAQTLALFTEPPAAAPSEPTPDPINNPPRIVSEPPGTVLAGDVYIYRINALDIDLFDELRYRQVSGPANAEVLPNSGILYWVTDKPGDYQFSVAVADNAGATDRQSFTVNVLPKPDWIRQKARIPAKPVIQNEYLAGMVFKDSDNDGFLSAGEDAAILIDLKTRSVAMDSVRLQLLTSVNHGEIEMETELIFDHCSPAQWSRKIVPIKGLDGLKNRSLVIRGILQDSTGIKLFPASLVIAARNLDI